MMANERSGQGRYCGRVQSSAVVGQRTSGWVARARCRQTKGPSTAGRRPPPPSIGAPVLAAAAARPNVLVLYRRRACHDSASTAVVRHAGPFRCPFMHAQLHHPPCATGLRTKSSHGPTHAMQHSAGPQASQHGGLRASLRREEGRGVFTYSTVRLTREWASLARDGEPESKILVASRVLVNQIHLNPAAGRLAGWQDGKVR